MNRLFIALMTTILMLAAPAAMAATYEVDPGHTRVIYHVKHLGFSNFYGHFNAITGMIDFDPEKPESGKVDITIDANSVSMDHDVLDEKLKGKEYFNTAKFPTITFKSTEVEKTGPASGHVTGNLTLLGVTKPVTLDVTFNNKAMNNYSKTMMVGFSATAKILRSDFGMKATLPAVGDEVILTIEAEASDKSAEKATEPAAKK